MGTTKNTLLKRRKLYAIILSNVVWQLLIHLPTCFSGIMSVSTIVDSSKHAELNMVNMVNL